MGKKKVLGIDLGSNSIGWALLSTDASGKPDSLIDLGTRIFNRAVEEKTPTPKNVKRRNCRLARRVIQRRARRKQRMLNYLISLGLLPDTLKNASHPEIVLNDLGDPYELRTRALDARLEPHELGRVLLHLVQRRGFLSNRKTLLSVEMLDDPDVQAVLAELGEDDPDRETPDKEENAFKQDINELREKIRESRSRTLGEYLNSLDINQCKRNRNHSGGHLRTDRQMYRDELEQIWRQQKQHHPLLTDDVKLQIEQIIFHQRPLKLDPDRVGKCSLEPRHKRCRTARLEYQKFRYLQDINNLRYLDPYKEQEVSLSTEDRTEDREKLCQLFEQTAQPTFGKIKKALGLEKNINFNLEGHVKKLKGNVTACTIRKVYPEWDNLTIDRQLALVEDLLSIKKKTALKKRLKNFWRMDGKTAVRLCMTEFEPGHGNHSLKAVQKLLPHLEQGMIYSDARKEAGYGYEQEAIDAVARLGPPPEIPNPIVQKGLHELRRVVNAIIAEYGKPDLIRIEMARDLEMNTKRYKAFQKQQEKNTEANEQAVEAYQTVVNKTPGLGMPPYPSKTDKIKYRLWLEQDKRCAYSNRQINLTTLFSAEIEIDHILPFSQSLDDSYMNKVVCFAGENRDKGNRAPIDAFGGDEEKWQQITSAISRWDQKKLKAKINRFYAQEDKLDNDFIGSQLTDTRYISKEAGNYLKTLGVDITYTKGVMTDWLRHHWNLNSLIGETDKKERTDHRHHAIDAVVTACIDRPFYQALADNAKSLGETRTGLTMRDLITDPPWQTLRADTEKKLNTMIVSFQPQRKITGALHEETGAGFIEGIGTVYRKDLNSKFKPENAENIVDPVVKAQVKKHLEAYDNNPKQAFAEGITVYHKNGKTPIKRVRVVQSKTVTIRTKLEKTKFGVHDKQGKVFRWMAYGNIHHVEIVRHKETGKYKGIFVTAMEAASRARGINNSKEPIIKMDHGEQTEFIMALHINDMVSVDIRGETRFYRVQKLEQQSNRLMLRLHTAATINNRDEEIHKYINTLMNDYAIAKHHINAIGR